MSFSYDLSENVGKVRLKIQDTVAATAKFSDEEIEYFLSEESSINLAAAAACDAMASRCAALAKSETIGDYSYNSGSQPSIWLEMAKSLRAKDEQSPAFSISDDVETTFHHLG